MDPNQMQGLVALLSGAMPQQASLSSPGDIGGNGPSPGTGGAWTGGVTTPGVSAKDPKPDVQHHQPSGGGGSGSYFSSSPVYDKNGNMIGTPVYNHGDVVGYNVPNNSGGGGGGGGGGDGKGGNGGDNTDDSVALPAPDETPGQLKQDRLENRVYWRSVREGPTGYGKAIQQNLGMDHPTVGYGGGLNHTSGMTNFMNLFTGKKAGM